VVPSAQPLQAVQPVRFAPRVLYEKAEVFEICAALALAEVLLARLGRQSDAAHMADVFDMAERALTRCEVQSAGRPARSPGPGEPARSPGPGEPALAPATPAASLLASNSRAREFTQ